MELSRREEAEVGAGGGVRLFPVFPKEIWSRIAEMMGDSSRIFKLIKAIPELEGALNERKKYWLFDQVIPHVSKWLDDKEVLVCRQVCKEWSLGVNNYLENHPTQRPYDHMNQVTGQIWRTDRSYRFSFGWLEFRSCGMINIFLRDMGNTGRRIDPFVNRYVSVDSSADIRILDATLDIIRRFGREIWFLTLDDYHHEDPEPFSRSLREWLDHLPNLKSLQLSIPARPMECIIEDEDEEMANNLEDDDDDNDEEYNSDPGDSEDEDADPVEAENIPDQEEDENLKPEEPEILSLEDWKKPLPPLPHFESLTINCPNFPAVITRALVASYSTQIRRLDLNLSQWKPEFLTVFPNLTELTIWDIPSSVEMNYILSFLHAPLLYSLKLVFEERCSLEIGTDILPWLSRFPLIQSLDLGEASVLGDNAMFSPASCLVPSLKHLDIGIQFLHANSDFLLCFPNLEFIDLEATSQDSLQGSAREPTVKIWESLENDRIYESNVWELLPKLKGFSLLSCTSWVQGDRANYDYQKKLAAAAAVN